MKVILERVVLEVNVVVVPLVKHLFSVY